jgi:hypothetical protein
MVGCILFPSFAQGWRVAIVANVAFEEGLSIARGAPRVPHRHDPVTIDASAKNLVRVGDHGHIDNPPSTGTTAPVM